MNRLFLIFICFLSHAFSFAQSTKNISALDNKAIQMRFPNGKAKALLLSYDDGHTEDRQLVNLLNRYALKGTFHLNSNKLDTKDYLKKDEIKALFKGHEVSIHTFNHPGLGNLTSKEIAYEVLEDQKELTRLMGDTIKGMAYPFGNYNDTVIAVIKKLGIHYARTVEDSYAFGIPDDFLKWHPSIHQFAKAYWKPNDPENDARELVLFYKTIHSFLEQKEVAVLDIWGHTWEQGSDTAKWQETERFIKLLAYNTDIYYTTQIELVAYIQAFQQLEFEDDKRVLFNPTSAILYYTYKNKVFAIEAGAKQKIKN
ncbi:MAG: polysaccharide deacetylase family protein [Bacteroidota bacterium]|nr:polysaccharide deacetylase family protein [Bacteroidota bacterium]